ASTSRASACQFSLLTPFIPRAVGPIVYQSKLHAGDLVSPAQCCSHIFSYAVGTPQISPAYWRIVRSEEKKPTLAVLRIAMDHQRSGSAQIRSTFSCAAQ